MPLEFLENIHLEHGLISCNNCDMILGCKYSEEFFAKVFNIRETTCSHLENVFNQNITMEQLCQPSTSYSGVITEMTRSENSDFPIDNSCENVVSSDLNMMSSSISEEDSSKIESFPSGLSSSFLEEINLDEFSDEDKLDIGLLESLIEKIGSDSPVDFQ